MTATTSNVGGDTLVEARDLRLRYVTSRSILGREKGFLDAVDGVSFNIDRGETLGLVGESGCGKSSLGRALLRLIEPSAGEVRIDGRLITGMDRNELRNSRRSSQMIFQDPMASVNPRMRISEILSEPMEIHGIGTPSERKARIDEMLEKVGLRPDAKRRYPHEFSGGQLQRIGIARALMVDTAFLVLDEPVSALDVSIQAQILNLLKDLEEEFGLTYLFIAHDLGVVRQISHRIAVMYLGQLVEVGPNEALYQAPAHPYTAALLSAVPIPDPERQGERETIILEGDVPDPANPPPGCRFQTRCWLRNSLGNPDICVDTEPGLRSIGDQRQVRCHFTEEMQTVTIKTTSRHTADPDSNAKDTL